MANYKFQIRKHLRDDMYKTESVDVELSDKEYQSITSDDSKYSKTSSLVSSKIGKNVQALGFPSKISASSNNKESSNNNSSSLWKPLWATPFKLVWKLIKMFLPFKF